MTRKEFLNVYHSNLSDDKCGYQVCSESGTSKGKEYDLNTDNDNLFITEVSISNDGEIKQKQIKEITIPFNVITRAFFSNGVLIISCFG